MSNITAEGLEQQAPVKRVWREDLAGRHFGRLFVRGEAPRLRGVRRWMCACDCGATAIVRHEHLKSGATQSCGCLRNETSARRCMKHGLSSTRTFRIWAGMLARCNTPSASGYERYGGAGIRVCERWASFEAFLADMDECPPGMEIDRKDIHGDYEPNNCRWVTRREQMQNRRTARWLTLNRETLSLTQWAERLGVGTSSLIERLRRWPLERALMEPRKT